MTTMVAEVYDAFVSAGASDEKARAAATAIAVYDQSTIKADIAALRGETKADIAALRGETRSDATSFRTEFATIRADIGGLKTDVAVLKTDVAVLKTDAAVLKWGMGLALAILVSLAAKAFF